MSRKMAPALRILAGAIAMLGIPCASHAALIPEEDGRSLSLAPELGFLISGRPEAKQGEPAYFHGAPLRLSLSTDLSPLGVAGGGGLKIGAKPPLNWSVRRAGQSLAIRADVALREKVSQPMPRVDDSAGLALRLSPAVGEDTGRAGEGGGAEAPSGAGKLAGFSLWPEQSGHEYGAGSFSAAPKGKETEKEVEQDAPLFVPLGLRMGGMVHTDYLTNYANNQAGTTRRNSGIQLNTGLSGYVWQPWFAQVSGNINFNLDSRKESASSDFNQYSIVGGAQMKFFPTSFFPADAYFNRENTQSYGISSTLTQVSQVGLIQGLNPRGTSDSYSLGFNRSVVEADTLGNLGASTVVSAYQGAANIKALGFPLMLSGSYRKSLNETRGSLSTQENQAENFETILRYNYTFDEYSSLNNDGSYSINSNSNATQRTATRFYQAGSTYIWRAEDEPLSGNVSARASMLEVDSGGAVTQIGQVFANSSLVYLYTPKLSFNASASYSKSSSAVVSSGAVGAAYRGDVRMFRGFTHSWATSGQGQFTTGAGQGGRASGSANQTLSRTWQDWVPGILTFNATQNVSPSVGSGVTNVGLTHAVNTNWMWNRGALQLTAMGSATDTRNIGTTTTGSQTVNAQLASGIQLDRYSRANASLNTNATREVSGNSLDTGAFLVTSNAMLGYNTNRFMGIRQLLFTTSVAADISNRAVASGNDFQSIPVNWKWDSQMTYRLGKTNFDARTQLSAIGGSTSGLIYFRAERRFGN